MNKVIKKVLKSIVVCGFVIALAMPVYAQNSTSDLESQAKTVACKTTRFSNTAVAQSVTRGMLLSSVSIKLTDKGFGIASIYADALCHEPMSAIYITLILQKWDEEHNSWQTVNRQEFEWLLEDLPEGTELTMASISYDIAGMQSGELYRVRGLFGAYDLEGTYNEAWNAYTEGVRF